MQSTEHLPPRTGNTEEWRVVPGFDGVYWASSLGCIWSTRKGRVLSHSVAGAGYLRVGMPLAPYRVTSGYVHRMVAAAFHGEPADGQQARHLDGNPKNNTPMNLARGDGVLNAADKLRHGTHPSQRDHCPNGHAYTPETTEIRSGGRRTNGKLCLICDRAGRRKRVAPVVDGRRLCPPEHPHGATVTCSNAHLCQCAPCRSALSAYRRQRGWK